MYTKILAVIFGLMFLSGCATPGRNTSAAELQSRIDYLEAELARKNQEIASLESELEEAAQAITTGWGRTRMEHKKKEASQLSLRQIQTALKNAGYYNGAIDGKSGPKTTKAIKVFQKANGLHPDGSVGKRTSEKLSRYLKNRRIGYGH